MKKEYITPSFEIEILKVEDIITTSSVNKNVDPFGLLEGNTDDEWSWSK